jgi:hypothetical protein
MLTRYCGDYAIADLELMRLSVSKVTSFNDPFELHVKQGQPLTRKGAKAVLRERLRANSLTFQQLAQAKYKGIWGKKLKKQIRQDRPQFVANYLSSEASLMESVRRIPTEGMNRKMRLMCLTKPQENDSGELPMWAYYADSHKGIRIHLTEAFINRDKSSVLPILYSDNPPAFDLAAGPSSPEYLEFFSVVLRTKSTAWSHENEQRLLIRLNRCFNEKDSNGEERDFTRVEPIHISRIDVGIRFNPQLLERTLKLKEKFPQLTVFKATKHSAAYYPIYEEIE